jgi:hypothetical protein
MSANTNPTPTELAAAVVSDLQQDMIEGVRYVMVDEEWQQIDWLAMGNDLVECLLVDGTVLSWTPEAFLDVLIGQ